MEMVRQRMIKPFKNEYRLRLLITILSLMGILSSCNPTEISGTGSRANILSNETGAYDGYAYVYADSPAMSTSESYTPAVVNIGKFSTGNPQFVTSNTSLTGNCTINFFFYGSYPVTLNDCVRSLTESTAITPTPRKSDRTFAFTPGTPEYYATNALYHINKVKNLFFEKLAFSYNQIHALPLTTPKSIPSYLKDSKLFWFKAVSNTDSRTFNSDFLTSYADCEVENAYFNAAGPTLCFGRLSAYPNFFFVQDPTIIYHEFGHALVSIMLNLRNGTGSQYHPLRSVMGTYGFDEASSMNEGIADYISFMVNGRTHLGEWALGRTTKQSRPMSESDSAHISGISETSEGRLSYPQFIHYDAYRPNTMVEDVHLTGQILTHYLVALTKTFKTECGLTSESDGGHSLATSYVMLLMAETLSEIGDLNAKGVDDFGVPFAADIYFNNLDYSSSFMWSSVVNQPNYRRFSQIFAKNIYKYITGRLCPSFDKNKSEKLLDDYGLLLFKTYNNNGNSTSNRAVTYTNAVSYIPTQALTAVSESNRRKSVLISKQLLELATKTETNSRPTYYLVDSPSQIQSVLTDLLFKGFPVPLSTRVAGTEYNNTNVKVSPGEIVGVIPNLLNNSNSTMAGVQVLATDWDHVDITDQTTGNFKPCVVDTVTTADQGGQTANTCTTTDTTYRRLVKNASTGLFPANAAAPVCMVQLDEGSTSRWVSQNEFRKKQGLSLLDKDCLGYSTSATSDTDFSFNPHECLVRFLPGANESFFSKIDAQKTFHESVIAEKDDQSFDSGSLLLLEVNKWIPPGTKFRCRLRARFSNCSDCYTDAANSNDDYLDSELNGSKPYKIINFDFDVND